MFDSEGTFITTVGSLGSGDYQFNQPRVAVDLSSNIYVADYGNSRVQKFVLSSSLLKPILNTGQATNVTSNSASLNGTVNPNGSPATYYFQCGTTIAYGNTTVSLSAGGYTGNVHVYAPLTGLTPNTTCHYRLVATNNGGTAYGANVTFTTKAIPPTAFATSALNVKGTSATLNGSINPNGSAQRPAHRWQAFSQTTSPLALVRGELVILATARTPRWEEAFVFLAASCGAFLVLNWAARGRHAPAGLRSNR